MSITSRPFVSPRVKGPMAGSWVNLIVGRAAIFDYVILKMGTGVFLGSFQYHSIYIIFDWMPYRRGIHEAHRNFVWMYGGSIRG